MNRLTEIQQQIAPELKALNTLISTTLHSPNELMNRVVETYLKTKGKQIRPILVILSAKLFGAVNDNVVASAASVELLHNASLIHDDVVDETKLRRNEPTINGIWDNHIAVLVGDFFVSSSLQLALSTGDIRIIEQIASLGKMLSLGEIDQIYNARYHHMSEEAYFGIIDRKTASLFEACVTMGAYASGKADERLDALRYFAAALGRCFQIKDDIFDYFDDACIGKPTGNDLREGKITLPLLHALIAGEGPENKRMTELSRKEVLTTSEIETLISYAKEMGGIDYAVEKMKSLRDKGVERLLSAFGQSPEVTNLVNLIDFTISRDC